MKNLICLWVVLGFVDQSLCGDPTSITAEPGQNVNLTCRADRNSIVIVVKLTRDDLDPRYVLLYRNNKINEDDQNPQYLGRTKQNLNTSNGEIYLTINNVTQNDSGKYECRVQTELKSNTRRKRSVFENTIIQLEVAAAPSGPAPPSLPQGRGHIGLVLGVMVVAMVAMVTVLAALTGFSGRRGLPLLPRMKL